MGKLANISGQRFGMLTAVQYTHRQLSSGRKMPAWRMRCDCGTEVIAMTVNIMKGKHQSCGCNRLSWMSERYAGDTKLPEYGVYRQMLDRCYLKTAPNFKWYGGDGVTVCDQWRFGVDGRTGFQCFIADMGRRPEGLTLDRIDPRKSYGPDNCRWATWAEQAKNRRADHLSPADRRRLYKARRAPFLGELATNAKLTNAQVAEIKRLIAKGARTSALATQFNVAAQTICGIKAGRTWTHIDPARAA